MNMQKYIHVYISFFFGGGIYVGFFYRLFVFCMFSKKNSCYGMCID